MSYCRFENTLADLRDCAENIDEQLELDGTEDKARVQLIKQCYAIAKDFMEPNGDLDLDAVNDLPVERD